MLTHPSFADRMAAEPITDNRETLMSAEAKRSLLSRLLASRQLNLGVVARVGGLAAIGGSTLGVADDVLTYAFFYVPHQSPYATEIDGITFHELGHVLGYGHFSSMTYPTNGRGFAPPLGEARLHPHHATSCTGRPWRTRCSRRPP